MKDLSDRLQTFREALIAYRTRLDERVSTLENLQKIVEALTTEEILLKKVDGVLLQISSQVLGASTSKIDTLVTHGLRTVFEGQDLSFTTEVDRFRGKTSVKFRLIHDGVEAPMADAFGGGPLVIAGVLLRVVAIMVLGLRRVLLLDESLAFVSDDYTASASKLLRKLCADLDFEILMVTHNPKFAEYADRHYAARAKGSGTSFVLMKRSA